MSAEYRASEVKQPGRLGGGGSLGELLWLQGGRPQLRASCGQQPYRHRPAVSVDVDLAEVLEILSGVRSGIVLARSVDEFDARTECGIHLVRAECPGVKGGAETNSQNGAKSVNCARSGL